MLRIRLFGSPQLSFEGGQVEVRPSALRLLSYLLVRHGKHSRKNIAFNLWPDDPEDVAQARLRRQLYNLRQALPNGISNGAWFRADDSSIGWDESSNYSLDIRDFERLIGENGSSIAADLYVGDLLDDADDEWVIVERERLRSLHISNLAKLISECRSKGDYQRGISHAERLLRLEPWREDIVRQLMALRYESGDRSGALRAFDAFAQRLQADMSVDPMPETSALALVINRNDSTLPDAASGLQPKASPDSLRGVPFVGREREMEFLRSCWQRAVACKGGGLFIAGESGIGKTRLATELAAFVEKSGGRVVTGLTTSPEAWPYQAFGGALRASLPMLATTDVRPIWLAVLSQLVPDIRIQLTDLPALAPLEKDREQRRLFDASSSALEALARARPLLVLLEDLHWAGASSIALLDFLMRRAYSNRILVVATYRVEEVSAEHPLFSMRRRLLREGIASQVEPARLSPAAIAALVEQMPQLERLSLAAERIYRASEGNPLLAIQTITDLSEGTAIGVLSAIPGHDAEHGETSSIAIIERTIASRTARLSPKARALAEVAAIIGAGFDLETVAEVTGWSADYTLDAVGELLDRRLVRENPQHGHDYVFVHHLIQSSIYAGVNETDRRRRHFHIARVTERHTQHGGDDLASYIAFHFERAGVQRRAGNHYMNAACNAFAVFANEEAIGLATRALGLDLDDPTRFEALALRADIHEHVGNRDLQRADVLAMDAIARRLGDPELMCRLLGKRITLAHELDERDSERALITELREIAERTKATSRLAEVAEAEGRFEAQTGNYAAANTHLETALALRMVLNDIRGAFECTMLLVDLARRRRDASQMQSQMKRLQEFASRHGSKVISLRTWEVASYVADHDENQPARIDAAQRWLAEAESASDVSAQARAHSALWNAESYLGRYDKAYRHADCAAELFERLGDRAGGARVLMDYSIALIRAWRLDEAKDRVLRAYSIFTEVEDASGQLSALSRLTSICHYLEDDQSTLAFARRLLQLSRRVASPFMRSTALGNISFLELRFGDLDSALRHVSRSIALARRHYLRVLPQLLSAQTEMLLRLGDVELAEVSLSECLELLDAAIPVMMFCHDNFFTAARVYHALGNKQRAAHFLRRSRDALQKAVDALPDTETKAAFLGYYVNRQILAAFERDEWPPVGPQPGDRLPRERAYRRALPTEH